MQSASKLLTPMIYPAGGKPRPLTLGSSRCVMRGCALLIFIAALFSPAAAQAQNGSSIARAAEPGILWSQPADIKARNLFYGPGGKEHLPQVPVRFVSEDRKGGSPKFDVTDQSGKKWRAKLGPEAQPETVATRLLWAVGYIANENYFFPDLVLENLPPHLHRGQEFVDPGGHVRNVRLQKHPAGASKKSKKTACWEWRHNPFYGTREFNGLRVMMALISNWDLTTDNNAVREDRQGEKLYEVTDLGASFGRPGRSYSEATSKNNLHAYQKSKFIAKVTPEYVDFNFPTHPPLLYVFDLKLFHDLVGPRWIGRHIPRADVRWIASLLAQLSPDQIQDAFRAAGYAPAQVEAFSAALEARMASLSRL